MQLLLFTILFLSVTIFTAAAAADSPLPTNSLLPSDAVSLLSFKSKADLDNKLLYTLNERFDYCQWQGTKCVQGRVVRFALRSFGLRGIFPPNTLTRLDQLRVLSLENNSLFGSIPDLSGLVNLKSLVLNRNSFSGSFPSSILFLHSLQVLDLSFNNFTGSIPVQLTGLDRITSLRLEWNRFNGSIPAFNQPFLVSFNVSGNNLTGQIPVTPILSRFDTTSFLRNPNLCGEIINIPCISPSPFFKNPNATSPSAPLRSTAQSQGGVVVSSALKKHERIRVILGISIGGTVLISSILCVFGLIRKQSKQRNLIESASISSPEVAPVDSRVRVQKNGGLVFCGGDTQIYTIEQLMRASAELLGKGTIGITYKAVMDNQMIVTVKRLDADKTTISSSEGFEQHLDTIGGLRHPNLVAIRAYFQAKGERLIIYDYQSNGSLFNLIHGSNSKRAKPIHWTSCLKIAEDVARGLAYIHQASKLIHGNLKSSNVLLGSDFEACLTDYCLTIFADCSSTDDFGSAYYKSPETRQSCRRATSKSDVYAFGILVLELLSGKHPSEHPLLMPTDVPDWVQAVRGSYGREDDQLRMLSEIASICSLTSPEHRPTMRQVLKMIEEIKDSVMADHNSIGAAFNGFS